MAFEGSVQKPSLCVVCPKRAGSEDRRAADPLHPLLDILTMPGQPCLSFFEQFVANLLDIAVRYNVYGGEIEISTGVAGRCAVLRVSNPGQMVPIEDVDRLFLPFQRMAPKRTNDGGLGLGLSIVRAIVDAHGATINAKARALGGMTIEVSFAARGGTTRALADRTLAGVA